MTNQVFWQEKQGENGIIRETSIPTQVEESQILVRVHAWAMNPADTMVQDMNLPFIKYPLVLGEDVAGTVELVGKAASSKFSLGDRVTGLALGADVKKAEHGAFQNYVVIEELLACKIPDSLSFVEASVLPLCINTAAGALFSKEFLGLPFPQLEPVSTGKTILICGGSAGVGSNAIQLCKAAGFRVVSTCSARNFDLVKDLGADAVYDYGSKTMVDDLVGEIDQSVCVGIFNAAGDVTPACEVARKSKQSFPVRSVTFVPEELASTGVDVKWVFSSDAFSLYREISPATFADFLPKALARGVYKIAPVPQVASIKGIEGIQNALDILKKGVSARKIVVEAE